jgi:integrase/recombinase XerD
MKNIEQIFEEYREHIKSRRSNANAIRLIRYFVEYFKNSSTGEMRVSLVRQYKEYLLEIRGDDGLYFSPSWIAGNMKTVRLFLNRSLKKGYIETNPFKDIREKPLLLECRRHYESRRQRLYEERNNKTDEEALKAFYEHSLKYYSRYYTEHLGRDFKKLREFMQEKGKRLDELTGSDFGELFRRWFSEERCAYVRQNALSTTQAVSRIKAFMRFRYEEGYTIRFVLKEWNKARVFEFVKKDAGKEKIRCRIYSVKEIMQRYLKFLSSYHSSYLDTEHYYNTVKRFIKFLKAQGKNLYTADKKTMEKYKEYLFNCEFEPGKYYTAKYQAERIRMIKRFYDWFTGERYRTEHPLKEYRPGDYLKELTRRMKAGKPEVKIIREVPPCFEKIYNFSIEHEKRLNFCKHALREHKKGFRALLNYLETQKIDNINEVDEQSIEKYFVHIEGLKNREGKPLSLNSKIRLMIETKRFFHYMARYKFIAFDPAYSMEVPKSRQGLPTPGMNHGEIKEIIKINEIKSGKDVRDRAIVETLYSTGVRANELRHIKPEEVDFDAGLVRINAPKGGIEYQRVIPIGKRACEWIKRYIAESRIGGLSEYLFLSQNGRQLSRGCILSIVKTWKLKAGIRRRIVTHSFRVSCATEMLKNKADIKYVQMQLGHRRITSTEKYLRLVPKDLKAVHSKCHPMERRGNS